MKLTAENTAVVLDSTADFPEAPERFPNFRVVPLYVRFGDESFRDYIDIDAGRVLRAPRRGGRAADDLAADAGRLPGDVTRSSRRRTSGSSRCRSPRPSPARIASARQAAELLGGEQVRVIDSRTVSASLAMLAIGVQRRLERGTTDEEIDALVARYRRSTSCSSRSTRSSTSPRAAGSAAPQRSPGSMLNVKPILTIRDGEVVPLKKVRGNQKAFAEFARAVRGDDDRRADAARRHRARGRARAPGGAARSWSRTCGRTRRSRSRRRSAPSSAPTPGPGTVGFFWYDDQTD